MEEVLLLSALIVLELARAATVPAIASIKDVVLYGNLAKDCRGNPNLLIDKNQRYLIYGNAMNSSTLTATSSSSNLLTSSCNITISAPPQWTMSIIYWDPFCHNWPAGFSLQVWDGNYHINATDDLPLLVSTLNDKKSNSSTLPSPCTSLQFVSSSNSISMTLVTSPNNNFSLFNFSMTVVAIDSSTPPDAGSRQNNLFVSISTPFILIFIVALAMAIDNHFRRRNNCCPCCCYRPPTPAVAVTCAATPAGEDSVVNDLNQPPPAYPIEQETRINNQAWWKKHRRHHKNNPVSHSQIDINVIENNSQHPKSYSSASAVPPPNYLEVIAETNYRQYLSPISEELDEHYN